MTAPSGRAPAVSILFTPPPSMHRVTLSPSWTKMAHQCHGSINRKGGKENNLKVASIKSGHVLLARTQSSVHSLLQGRLENVGSQLRSLFLKNTEQIVEDK